MPRTPKAELPPPPDATLVPPPPPPPPPAPTRAWAVLSPALNSAKRIEAERMYLSGGCLTFMVGQDIVFSFAPGAWTTVMLET